MEPHLPRGDLTSARHARSSTERLQSNQTGKRTGSRPQAAKGGGASAPALRPADRRVYFQHSCLYWRETGLDIWLIWVWREAKRIFKKVWTATQISGPGVLGVALAVRAFAESYRPLNCGLRFSMKARRPSRKSSESMQVVPIALTAAVSRWSGSFRTSAIVILAA